MVYQLTTDQKEKIRQYVPLFHEYQASPQSKADLNERKERLALYQPLTKEQILQLDEADILGLITKLWATQFWKNQQYILEKLISDNGFEKLKKELAELLCGDGEVTKRYEIFMKLIKHLGPASITEMLSSKDPDKCAIWNDKARKALTILCFEGVLPLRKYKITGKELAKFNDVCWGIANELAETGMDKPDLFGVDYFLYEVTLSSPVSVRTPKTINKEKDFDHDEIGEHLRDIGIWLGFHADVRQKVGHGAEVDVLWRAQIGNLGVVTYIFEVQKKGSIDSLILNLQKAKANPTVQKVVAVSDIGQLEKIRKETIGLQAEFRDALAFMQISEVEQVHENLSQAMSTIERLELVKDLFPIEGKKNGG